MLIVEMERFFGIDCTASVEEVLLYSMEWSFKILMHVLCQVSLVFVRWDDVRMESVLLLLLKPSMRRRSDTCSLMYP